MKEKRLFLDISYAGTNYSGWQRQTNQITIQQTLEDALKIILKQNITTYAAGRTDTGVHAKQQIVHFDYNGELPKYFRYALNSVLPKDISINTILIPQKENLHARFSAIRRTYEYRIIRNKNPFLIDFALTLWWQLDITLMQQAANILFEYVDFASFAKIGSNNHTTICHISKANWENIEDGFLFTISADRFLWGMVRTLVGTLIYVGRNAISLEQFRQIIEFKDRKHGGRLISPKGLMLKEVLYPHNSFIPLD